MDTVFQASAGHCTRLAPLTQTDKLLNSELLSIQIPGKVPTNPEKAVAVHVADSEDDRRSAAMLIERMYSWRGYDTGSPVWSGTAETVFTASIDSEVVGTLTLAADSDEGLSVEKTFPEELQSFREDPGSSLCELKRFAVDADMSSKNLLAALFHTVLIFGSDRYASTDLFIEVNPRHIRFYESMLGFQRIGGLKINASVNAPSQLMWLRVANIRRMIQQHVGKNPVSGRSLYPYFLTPNDELMICTRIAAMKGSSAPDLLNAQSIRDQLPIRRRSLAA